MRRAAFLDRDGVIVGEGVLERPTEALVVLPRAADATARLASAGYLVIVVTNQTAVARGLLTMAEVDQRHAELIADVARAGGVIDAVYACPHHPDAEVERYRQDCDCRKPRPGLIRRAARELDIDLAESIVIGDRWTDLEAGVRAGCKTGLVVTPTLDAARIETSEGAIEVIPDYRGRGLDAVVHQFLGVRG